METTYTDYPQASFLSLRPCASHDSVDLIVTDESMEPSGVVAASKANLSFASSMTDTAAEKVGHENPKVDQPHPAIENESTTTSSEGGTPKSISAKDVAMHKNATTCCEKLNGVDTPTIAETMEQAAEETTASMNVPAVVNKPQAEVPPPPPTGFPASPYIVPDKDLPEWMRKFKQMGLDNVSEDVPK
jgi:hypothetical protein